VWFRQVGALAGQSALPPHSMQMPPAQTGRPDGQSLARWQVATQRPSWVLQVGVGAEQSVFDVHAA
jgi:hypothetical protein